MKIAIIGSGLLGGTLARRLAAAGHEVRVCNSRGPASLADFAAQTGTIASTIEDALCWEADAIFVAVPLKNVVDLPKTLFANLPTSTTLIDVTNYYPSIRDGQIPEIDVSLTESEWVQAQVGHPVVKAFNTIVFCSLEGLGKASGTSARIALPLAGDGPEDKAKVSALIDELGFDPLDAGPLSESWRQQPGTPAYCTDLTLEELTAALQSADRAAAIGLREESIRLNASLGANADPRDYVKGFRRQFGFES